MSENAVTPEQLFDEFDSDKDGSISDSDFLKLLAKPAELVTDEKNKEKLKSEGDVERLFSYLNEEGDGELMTKEIFTQQTVRIMRIVKEVALTNIFNIKESETIRRLELKEDVKVLEGPKMEEATEVQRV